MPGRCCWSRACSALAVAGRWPVVATLGDWSPDALTLTIPEPVFVGLAAAAAAVLLGVRAAWRAGGLIVLLGRSDRRSRRLRSGGAPIVFVDDPTADAFTVAGVRGCVVISRSLFAALGPEERQTLVAHGVVPPAAPAPPVRPRGLDLAVAANPALTPLGAVVRLGVERWADEDAAAACGARATAGRALARTALVQAALRRAVDSPALTHPSSVLCATAGGVAVRAQALMNVPTPRRSRPLYFLVALLLVTGVLSLCSIVRIHEGFESAELHPDRVAENINDSRASVQVRCAGQPGGEPLGGEPDDFVGVGLVVGRRLILVVGTVDDVSGGVGAGDIVHQHVGRGRRNHLIIRPGDGQHGAGVAADVGQRVGLLDGVEPTQGELETARVGPRSTYPSTRA